MELTEIAMHYQEKYKHYTYRRSIYRGNIMLSVLHVRNNVGYFTILRTKQRTIVDRCTNRTYTQTHYRLRIHYITHQIYLFQALCQTGFRYLYILLVSLTLASWSEHRVLIATAF